MEVGRRDTTGARLALARTSSTRRIEPSRPHPARGQTNHRNRTERTNDATPVRTMEPLARRPCLCLSISTHPALLPLTVIILQCVFPQTHAHLSSRGPSYSMILTNMRTFIPLSTRFPYLSTYTAQRQCDHVCVRAHSLTTGSTIIHRKTRVTQ